MRFVIVLGFLAVLLSACDQNSPRQSSTYTRTVASYQEGTPTIVTLTGYTGEWPADGEELVKRLIPDRWVKRTHIRCGNLSSMGRGTCSATWTDSDGSECEAEFTFYASGPNLAKVYDGTLTSCTTLRIR